MIKATLALIAPILVSSCAGDESISGYADTNAVYVLVEIDGTAFEQSATLQFPEQGRITGRAPCNSYFGAQTEIYPWFGVEAIGATRMACADLEAEVAFFTALQDMTLAEVANGTLILSNTAGREMVFVTR